LKIKYDLALSEEERDALIERLKLERQVRDSISRIYPDLDNEVTKKLDLVLAVQDRLRKLEPTKTLIEMPHAGKHDRACLEYHGRYYLYMQWFERKYPNYCRKCLGTGYLTYWENQAPFGSGNYWPMKMSEPCEACWGKCPRCGYEFKAEEYDAFIDSKMPCPSCSFVLDEPDQALPWPPPECGCYRYEDV